MPVGNSHLRDDVGLRTVCMSAAGVSIEPLLASYKGLFEEKDIF